MCIIPGAMTLLTSGMMVGSTIFNMDLQNQAWTFDHSDSLVLAVSMIFYIAAIVGTLAGYLLVDRYEKKPLSVSGSKVSAQIHHLTSVLYSP